MDGHGFYFLFGVAVVVVAIIADIHIVFIGLFGVPYLLMYILYFGRNEPATQWNFEGIWFRRRKT